VLVGQSAKTLAQLVAGLIKRIIRRAARGCQPVVDQAPAPKPSPPPPPPPPSTGPAPRSVPAVKVTDLTGPGCSEFWGIGGTDLGAPTLTEDGRLLLVFGDTFDQFEAGGPGWRSPTALFADPDSLTRGLRWTGAAPGADGSDTRAGQLVPQPHNTRIRGFHVTTQLPSDVVRLGDVLYLQVMGCQGLGNVHFTELYESRDNGRTWSSTGCWWPGDHWNGWFQNLTWCPGDDGYLYCVSSGFQRDKGLMLSRVRVKQLTDPDAWEPWGWTPTGGWAWGNPPGVVLPGAFGEQCLRRIDDRWVLSVFDAGHYRIDVRLLLSPTADMTAAPVNTVAQGVAWGREDHIRGQVAQLYGGYLLPGSRLDDVHLVISQWNTGPANTPYRSMQFHVDLTAVAQDNISADSPDSAPGPRD
jgi:hypothetical protein